MDTDKLRVRLKLRSFASERKLLTNHVAAREFFARVKLRPMTLLTSGALASTLLLSSPMPLPVPPQSKINIDVNTSLSTELKRILPNQVEVLTPDQETQISKVVKNILGVNAVARLDGNHLNQTYGYMGAEQHLARFSGDNVENMAPGLGGWGYVSDFEVEKYYIAVQTLYLPDWNTNTQYLSKWYRFRKSLAINPNNGKAIITAIADAGPSWWTGKHFGGSPEVMAYLGHNVGMQKGPTIIFFVDDPNNLIPLGPIEYNKIYDKYIL